MLFPKLDEWDETNHFVMFFIISLVINTLIYIK
jgi:hypothetical protein